MRVPKGDKGGGISTPSSELETGPKIEPGPASHEDAPKVASSSALGLGPAVWSGSPTSGTSIPTAGQTAAPYLAGKSFERVSRDKLGSEFEALLSTWPKDTAPGATPPAFIEKATALDGYKAQLLAAVFEAPSPTRLRQLVGDLNVLHGKPGHTENVIALLYALMAKPTVSSALELSGPSARIAAAELLVEAASWLNLCDARIPVSILCAPRRLSDEEHAQYVKPRPTQSAALLEKLGLSSRDVVALVKSHRGGGDRAPLAQLLDLADQTAAMAAKPFFQKEGKVDIEKLTGAVRGNAEKAGLTPALVEAVIKALSAGIADEALAKARQQDLWVRP